MREEELSKACKHITGGGAGGSNILVIYHLEQLLLVTSLFQTIILPSLGGCR